MTGFGLISAGNADFRILGFDPAVVAVLVGLIAVGGPFLALVDAALERWLPRPGPGRRVSTGVYLAILILGVLLATLVVAPGYLGSPIPLAGVAMIVTGVATLLAWSERLGAGLDRRLDRRGAVARPRRPGRRHAGRAGVPRRAGRGDPRPGLNARTPGTRRAPGVSRDRQVSAETAGRVGMIPPMPMAR